MRDELAEGSYIPKEFGEEIASVKREAMGRTYSRHIISGYDANELLSDFQGNFKQIVELSHYYADKIGIVKSAVRIYITLTIGEITLEGGSKKNKNYFTKLVERTQLNKILRQSIPDLYKSGNIFWYRETEGKETVWIHQLNPIDVDVKGHRRGRPIATLRTLNDPDTLPDDLLDEFTGTYKLNLRKTYHVANDREAYLRYGKPITTACFEPIQHIEKLLDMESESIDSIVDSLIIITLGDEKRPATQNQINELKKKVTNLKSTSRLVGNHTLKAQVIEKDISVFNKEKFEVPLQMLMQSIGITPSIFTGEGSESTALVGMQSATKTIQTARMEIEDELNNMFEDIALEVGLDPKNNPKVTLGKLDLNDDEIQHAIIRNLYLDGVLSAKTYAKVHGYNVDLEQEQIALEEKYDITPRPLSSTMSYAMDDGTGEETTPQESDKKSEQKDNNGGSGTKGKS